MNETNPTDPADTAAKPKAPTESATAPGALDGAKQKLASLAEKAKEHDFKGDAHKAAEGVKNLAENLKQRDFKEDACKAAEGVKNLKESLKTHDFKAELRDAFAETKKNPASIWKKPETLRPGKDLAVVGLAASVVLLLLLLVTSSSFLGLVCLVLGLGALLFSALGLKTEGRKLAVGGSVVGLLVLLCALGQTFGSSEGGDATDGEQAVASTDEDGTKAAPMVGSNPKAYPVPTANKGTKTGNAEKILKAAEQAPKLNSLNFYGFYTGMSAADFETLREHYGLTDKQLFFEYNWENGEVYNMCFTPKALDLITHWPNNFDTVEINMLEYFGIADWNNSREVFEGEVDSIFQSDEERLFFGDKANVPRKFRTADGVIAKLFPKGWDQSKYEVFNILDTERQKTAAPVKRHFQFTFTMRTTGNKLEANGIKTKMLMLPGDVELLMKEDSEHGLWVSEFPLLKWQLETVLSVAKSVLVSKEPASDDTPVLIVKQNFESQYRTHSAWEKYDDSNFFLVDKTKNGPRESVPFKEFTKKLTDLPSVVDSRLAFWQEPEFGESERVVKGGRIDNTVFLIAAPKETIAVWTQKGIEAEKAEAARREVELKENRQRAIKDNNGRCDAVKPVLDNANVGNRVIELPEGVRLLMTHVGQTAPLGFSGSVSVDWVSTFEVTEAQVMSLDQNHPVPAHGDLPYLFPGEGEAKAFVGKLNAVAPSGWTFSYPTQFQWNLIAGEFDKDRESVRFTTLKGRVEGKKLSDFERVHLRPSSFKFDAEIGTVGREEPNYFGLCDVLGNACELEQTYYDALHYGGIWDTRRSNGALRLFATFDSAKAGSADTQNNAR